MLDGLRGSVKPWKPRVGRARPSPDRLVFQRPTRVVRVVSVALLAPQRSHSRARNMHE
jgi:hypothetical protein